MLGRLSERGQADYAKGIGILIVSIAVFALLYGVISQTMTEQRTGTYYPDNTANRYMTDNTAGVPNSWENHCITDNRAAQLDNYGIANHFLQENDNGLMYWSQSFVLADIYDWCDSATIAFAYQVSDNSGIAGGSHVLKVLLERPGGDNITIWDNSVTTGHIAADNSTWHTQENDVTSLITAAGTYTLFLWDNASTISAANMDNVVVRWDNAYLSVTAYERSMTEQIGDESAPSVTRIFMLLIVVAVVVAVAIILREMQMI